MKAKKFLVLMIIGILMTSSILFAACYNEDEYIPTGMMANDYEVVKTTAEHGLVYQPQVQTEWGFIFYLGTFMQLENYDYILTEIASKGVAIYVSDKQRADLDYDDIEYGYEVLGLDKYFIGGHSQGGGAALRRAVENPDTTKGCIFYSALVSNDCTLKDSTLPAILFEAENDRVLTSSQKQDTKERMNELCEYFMLKGANHMCYGAASVGAMDGKNTRDKTEIQNEVIRYTVEFMERVINAQA